MPIKGGKHVTAGERRWMGEFVTPTVDWQVAVLEMLLEAGSNGLTQSVLTNRVYGLGVTASQLRLYLETYRAELGVQRFSIGKTTIWRATTRLRKLV